MDKNDLAALLVDAPAEEVDRIHRLLHEWGIGPDNSFPVQTTLLTKAQWRMAATLPRVMEDARKLIELHLAEYRRQTKSLLDDLSGTSQRQVEDLKVVTDNYTQTLQTTIMSIKLQLVDAEIVARRVKLALEGSISEWKKIEASTTAQCERLEAVSNDLQDRFAWRVILEMTIWLSLVLGLGILGGHFLWKH